jgi:hypothetical protein
VTINSHRQSCSFQAIRSSYQVVVALSNPQVMCLHTTRLLKCRPLPERTSQERDVATMPSNSDTPVSSQSSFLFFHQKLGFLSRIPCKYIDVRSNTCGCEFLCVQDIFRFILNSSDLGSPERSRPMPNYSFVSRPAKFVKICK